MEVASCSPNCEQPTAKLTGNVVVKAPCKAGDDYPTVYIDGSGSGSTSGRELRARTWGVSQQQTLGADGLTVNCAAPTTALSTLIAEASSAG